MTEHVFIYNKSICSLVAELRNFIYMITELFRALSKACLIPTLPKHARFTALLTTDDLTQ